MFHRTSGSTRKHLPLLALVLGVALAGCGDTEDDETCDDPAGCAEAPGGSGGSGGGGGGGGGAGGGAGGAGGSAGGGSGGSDVPLDACDRMCNHVYDDCGYRFADPSGYYEREDCWDYCVDSGMPDVVLDCLETMECSLDVMYTCMGYELPTADCVAACENIFECQGREDEQTEYLCGIVCTNSWSDELHACILEAECSELPLCYSMEQ